MEVSELEGRLRHWLGSRYGNPETWAFELISERGKAGHERRLLRAHEARTGLTLAIKANSNPKSNVRQFRALRSMSEHTQDCVTPIELDGDNRFYSMSWIDAPLLDTRLEGSGRETALARAGDWLSRLHAATSGRPSRGSTGHVLQPPPTRGKGAIRATADRLRRRMRAVPRRRNATVMLHGDFHPGNLFDLGSRVVAFDRKFDRHGSPFSDAARFLLSVAALRDRAAGNGHPWAGDSDSDRRSFFEGWGPLEEPDLPLFDLVEDVTLFNRWNRLTQLGDHRLDHQVEARGLLSAAGSGSRPGRLVRQAGNALWTREPAPELHLGLLSRLLGRWRRSGAATAGRA